MKFAGLSLTGFLLCATVGVAHGRIRNRNLEGHVDPDCPENGYEVWQQQPNENVALKLDTVVDADTCEYQLTLSWKPDEELPFLAAASADSFFGGMEQQEYEDTCAAEGFFETAPDNVLTPEQHVGLNEFYTDYAYYIDLSERAQERIGFKLATLGASPCGTFLQPWPQYSVHFYTIDTDGRKEMKCFSDGGYFCKKIDEQCGEHGRAMNMDGAGLPTCPDAPAGPPQYQNVPEGFFWTLDDSVVGTNAASPGMGLHGLDPSEFATGRDSTIPYTLMLNYNSTVIGNHVLLWSGFANGETGNFTYYEKDTPTYNCPTPDRSFLPTKTIVEYDPTEGRTSVSVRGPLLNCEGESFTEVSDYTHESEDDLRETQEVDGPPEELIVDGPTEESIDDGAGDCDENGYEIWRQADPADINMSIDSSISEDGCGYEISVSWTPPTNLPGEDFISKVLALPENFDELCNAEGRPENDAFPVRHEGVGPDHHVGLNDNFAEFTYTLPVPEDVKALTGYDHITVGAAPCGTFLQPVPHYNIHFYRVDIPAREAMTCVSDGGFFCKRAERQCSEAGLKFNMAGDTLRCEESFGSAANVPSGFLWTDDNSAIGTNAASAGMGLHGLNPLTLPQQGGDPTMPNRFILNYDQETIADHVVMWAGFSLGFANSTSYEVNTPRYNCLEEPKYSSLPKKTTATTDNSTTTVTMYGTTNECATIPKTEPCGRTTLRFAETFNLLTAMLLNENSALGGTRFAGDYDTWSDDLFVFEEPPAETYGFGSFAAPAKLKRKVGRHYGRCAYVDSVTQQCEGTMYIDDNEIGHGSITIMGATPIPLGQFAPYNPEIEFTISGGTGDWVGAYGSVRPGVIPFMADPDDFSDMLPATADMPNFFSFTGCPDGGLPESTSDPSCTFLALSYYLDLACLPDINDAPARKA